MVEVDLTPAERTELEARAEAGRSLRRNLERMCRPASDAEGGEGGGRFAAEERMERIRRDMDPDADDDDDDADSSGDEDAADEGAAIDDDDPDRSFEETQLVDQDALRRARELRGRVRDLASRIRRGREGTTRRASELVGREVEAMRLAVGAGGGGMGDVDDADAEDDAGAAAAMAMAQVEEVREALRSLEVAARGLEGGGGPARPWPTWPPRRRRSRGRWSGGGEPEPEPERRRSSARPSAPSWPSPSGRARGGRCTRPRIRRPGPGSGPWIPRTGWPPSLTGGRPRPWSDGLRGRSVRFGQRWRHL